METARAVKLVGNGYWSLIFAAYHKIRPEYFNMPRTGEYMSRVVEPGSFRNYSNLLFDGLQLLDRRVVRLGISLSRQPDDPQQRTPPTVMRSLHLACREHQGMGRHRGRQFASVLRMSGLDAVSHVDIVILEYVDDVLQVVADDHAIPTPPWFAGA